MKKIVSLFFLSFIVRQISFAQNIGIDNTNPQAKLDINGDLILRSHSLTVTAAVIYSLDVNTNKFSNYKLTLTGPTGNFAIAGITAAVNDRTITLYNRTGASMEIYNDDITAIAGNRIFTGTGTTFAVYNGGSITLRYDSGNQHWEVTSSHFNNLNYFGNTWTTYGNSGITINDFIGTLDNSALRFKVNNIASGIIDPLKDNSSFGYYSLLNNTTGTNNFSAGSYALQSNTTGSNNTAVGGSALFTNSIGKNNIAIGSGALGSNTSGYSNIAIGVHALSQNSDGNNLIAIGDSALFHAKSSWQLPNDNIAVGSKALYEMSTALGNVAIGNEALKDNTESFNTAVGCRTLASNISGNNNCAFGYYTLSNNKGFNNTAVGSRSMQNNDLGIQNTTVGFAAEMSTNDQVYSMALGCFSISNASRKIVLGNSTPNMSIGGYAPWTNLSDGRFKQNIQDNVPGLSFIRDLRPVTYTIDIDKLQHHITAQMPDSIARNYYPTKENISDADTEIKTGFIAQEVETLAKKIGYQFDGIYVPRNPTDNYGIAYSQFVVPLVKAVQEQQTMIEKLQQQNEALLKRIEKLETK